MKLKTLLALSKGGLTLDELKASGATHVVVDPDGYIFSFKGKHRPLARIFPVTILYCAFDSGWYTCLGPETIGNDCSIVSVVGRLNHLPTNWHRMIWEVK